MKFKSLCCLRQPTKIKQKNPPSKLQATYKSLLEKHMYDSRTITQALSDIHHPLWQQLAAHFSSASDAEVQQLLTSVHAEAGTYGLPAGAVRRPTAKRVARIRSKLAQTLESKRERAVFTDWMACRLEGRYETFDELKALFEEHLSDATLVWREDMPESKGKAPDIAQYGYVFRPGALAVMEIQIVEPIAAWIFSCNSRNKHAGEKGFVTFKESSALYSAVKEAIVQGRSVDGVDVSDVSAYYRKGRKIRGEDASVLDQDELQKLQGLIDERFLL